MMKWKVLIWLFIASEAAIEAVEEEYLGDNLPRSPVLQTKYGKVQGRLVDLKKQPHLQPVFIFKGIPYATPPVGSNR